MYLLHDFTRSFKYRPRKKSLSLIKITSLNESCSITWFIFFASRLLLTLLKASYSQCRFIQLIDSSTTPVLYTQKFSFTLISSSGGLIFCKTFPFFLLRRICALSVARFMNSTLLYLASSCDISIKLEPISDCHG